jgi:hypothetical protein
MGTTYHHLLEIQDLVVYSSSSTAIESSLTRSTAGDYEEQNFFYLNDSAASREERTIEKLLAWLNYVGMDRRCETVDIPHTNTFQWIFDGHAEEPTASQWFFESMQPKNIGFVTWLRQETGVFWIYGKPGAGKSTLMKYIMEDPRLKEHANVWAGSHELSISSFYFWKLGSKIQKSLTGLYRALLWQILNDDRALARKAFPSWQRSFNKTVMGPGEYKAALDRLIKASVPRKKFLILIDGLDECEDEGCDAMTSQERLCEDLLQMVRSGFVKIIIASRLDRALESHFSHCRKLAVHDLTAWDIELFARGRLIGDRTTRPSDESFSPNEISRLHHIVRYIVRDSQGVFLWARIVVNLARFHIRNHHDADELGDILTKLPSGLEELFDELMGKIWNLERTERVESLRYLAITSHWFTTVADKEEESSHWLSLSVLGVGCELSSQNVTESWLHDNLQRLEENGCNESRIEGRIKSCCFGLLEASATELENSTTSQQTPIEKRIRPLHRTLMEYLSNHTVMQNAQNFSLPDHEPFDTSTAILLGLVVQDHQHPYLWRKGGAPSLFHMVLVFNKMTGESTGSANIAILSKFDRTIKKGFKDQANGICPLEYGHELRCASSSPDIYLDRTLRGVKYVRTFENLVEIFHSDPRRPSISGTYCHEEFLDLLAITIATNSNTLLKHWSDNIASDSALSGAILSAECATRPLRYAPNKHRLRSVSLFGRRHGRPDVEAGPNIEALQPLLRHGGCLRTARDGISWARVGTVPVISVVEYATHLLKHALNKEDFESVSSGQFRDSDVVDPNIEALQLLLRLGGNPDKRFDGLSAWERFLDGMFQRTMNEAMSTQFGPIKKYETAHTLRRLEALHVLVSHGARQDASPTWAVFLEDRGPLSESRSFTPGALREVEFRRYSVVQMARQAMSMLHQDSVYTSETTKFERMQHRLEKENAQSAPSRRCSWSDLQRALKISPPKWEEHWRTVEKALAVVQHRKGRDIAKYQRILLPHDEGFATWLPHGCREKQESPNRWVPNKGQRCIDRLMLQEGVPANFDVVGLLIYNYSRQ